MPFRPDNRFYPPRNFAALEPEYSDYDRAGVVILPVPYDSTTTARAGAREAPQAIIDASADMELYDVFLEQEPYLVGIHTLPEVAPHSDSPAAMAERVESIVGDLLDDGKFVVALGGEHTVAVGPFRAHAKRTDNLSVLAFDAHSDMRDEYLDSALNHACTLRRISDLASVTQVGLRSASKEDHEYIRSRGFHFYQPHELRRLVNAPANVAADLTENVYITIDLDCFDPSVMAGVGTPEPGGLTWEEVNAILMEVARTRRIVGFDVTELAPDYGLRANAQLAAKLTYRLIGLAMQGMHEA
jgi:agmatinase